MWRSAIAAAVLVAACTQEPRPAASQQPAPPPSLPIMLDGYDLGAPRRSFALPHKLREISAIVAVDATTIACLQDEKGELFWFDLANGTVRERARFGPDGDYEGLALVGADFWVLRSDGRLLQLRRSDGELEIARKVTVEAPQKEFEGLAWDAARGVLVVAPKAVSKELGDKDQRPLYAVDPATGTTRAEPYAVLDRDAVLAAAARLHVEVPTKSTRGGERPAFRLRFSEVAVQPQTGALWLLSGVDRAVIVAERSGEVRGLHFFAASELPQPEGATFLPDGDLAIASEGDGGAAVLRVYGKPR
jgi:uncharacterized protein YjiK